MNEFVEDLDLELVCLIDVLNPTVHSLSCRIKHVLEVIKRLVTVVTRLIPANVTSKQHEKSSFKICWKHYDKAIDLYWDRIHLEKRGKEVKVVVEKELQIMPIEILLPNWCTQQRWFNQKKRTFDFCQDHAPVSIPVYLQDIIVSFQNKL